MSRESAVRPVGAGRATERRVASILGVAEDLRTGVSVDRLTELLPSDGPRSASDLATWFSDHPSFGTVVDGTAFDPGARWSVEDLDARRARGQRYWARALELGERQLAMARPLLRALVVTGSAAYGEPDAGDDLDFLAVTRRDTLWVFLAYAYLRERFSSASDGSVDRPSPCFNYVLDETIAEERFVGSRGLLFAREALTSRPVLGESYYRGLLGSAEWMQNELPRLYARWKPDLDGPAVVGPSPPWVVRGLNCILFPIVSAYLQLQGLVRNHRLLRSGQPDRAFRTVARYRSLLFATERFERLRRAHESDVASLGATA